MTSDEQPVRPDDRVALTPDVTPSALQVPAGRDQDQAASQRNGDHRASARDVAIVGLFVLAVVYTLHVAQSLLLPIVLAVLLDFMLSPVIRWLKRFRIPEPFGAGLVVLLLLAGVSVTVYQLSSPASEWIARTPASIDRVRHRLDAIRKPVEQMSRAAQRVEQATDVAPDRTPQVAIKGPSLVSQMFGGTASLIGNATMVVFLLYFLLAAGDLFLQKLVTVLPQLRDKKKAVQIARETEAQISVYLFTTVLINTGVGIVTGFVLYFLGMPNPVLWGVVAGVLNFVPYIGAVANTVVLAMAAFVTFESTTHALMIPAAFLGLNLIESNLVTPVILGRRMRLNTVAVFVGLIFWWYIWGITGAIIAVPLVAVLKIVCDHIESLRPFGEFLGEKR
jgi:predicted PurR-regulated permease PerM